MMKNTVTKILHGGNFLLLKGERDGLSLIQHLLTVAGVFRREHASIVLQMHPLVTLWKINLLFPPFEHVNNFLHLLRFGISFTCCR
jgi:hypothetical protein